MIENMKTDIKEKPAMSGIEYNSDEYKKLEQLDKIEWLSLKLFDKNSKDINYLLCTNFIHQQLISEEISRTGLYQWLNVFDGDVKFPRDVLDYSKYDIVQVNLSTQDMALLSDISEELGEDRKTKLVLNNDYTTEMWGQSFFHPTMMGREVKKADMIFGTEYYMATAMSEMAKRPCYVIPHPGDIKRLKTIGVVPKKNIISTIWRRYDKHSYIPSLVVKNHGLTTQLIGYDMKLDPKNWLTTTLYDYAFAGTNFFEFSKQLQESKIVYDPFTYHSYNRAVVECAAMGVAVVGSNRTQSVNVCYPFTAVDPYDVTTARNLIDKLLSDKEFYDKVVNYAKEHSETYNHKNSLFKYLSALFEEQNRKEKKVVEIKKRSVNECSVGDDVNMLVGREKNRKNDKKN